MTSRLTVVVAALLLSVFSCPCLWAQSSSKGTQETKAPGQQTANGDPSRELRNMPVDTAISATPSYVSSFEYRIGPEDLLEISVFEALELNRSVRVTAGGEISLPLLGLIRAADLTPRELESVLEELLRRTFLKDPHVGVFVSAMYSHTVSVVGAVRKPGVYQIRQPRTLLEILSMAEGLAEDSGDTVIVMRGLAASGSGSVNPPRQGAPDPNSEGDEGDRISPFGVTAISGEHEIRVNLKDLLEKSQLQHNIIIYPGDTIKVLKAGIVYVVGEVNKPGGFALRTNENISVLQALSLAEGLGRTASKGNARIIRTDPNTGKRVEIAIDLEKILTGEAQDPIVMPNDIVFVPNSRVRAGLSRVVEATISTITGILVFRR